MRRVLPALLAAAALAGCSAQPAPEAPPSPSAPATTAVQLPPEPTPARAAPCPYLENSFVADSNGQRVSKVEISADQPHPTCFFYALSGKLQLTVRVYTGDPAVANALVDQAAPVATSNPAAEPPGWQGGYASKPDGAVYAVARDGTAVIVTTNQQQTVKARTVARQAISRL
ncbi:DUF2020 domain-containing protein [Amycolatopsis thermalba]|uniref:DUF2020 domain-containing protein n=1 Tax=Amycolatopsis thermalba TaxID=944492 RepID=A0ABY4NMP4_9PSEU|nr:MULTISPECIES: DUF2020 domain-containing protein [Amycolatopsis]UQS21783.1 DUF2020 domain-containing protein [Amycolatopsis thermalba]